MTRSGRRVSENGSAHSLHRWHEAKPSPRIDLRCCTVPSELMNEIVRRLVAEFDPEQVILFGSRDVGNAP